MKTSILVREEINVIKKINKLPVIFHVRFVTKRHEFRKKICPAWREECKLCKIKNRFESSLVGEESKTQKASNKNKSTNFTECN